MGTSTICSEKKMPREKALSELGLRMIRFGNDEVMKSLSAVVGKIKESLARV